MFFNLLHSSSIYLTTPLFPRGIREKTKPNGEPKWRKLNASKKETSKKITLCSNCQIFDRCPPGNEYFQLKDKIFTLWVFLIFCENVLTWGEKLIFLSVERIRSTFGLLNLFNKLRYLMHTGQIRTCTPKFQWFFWLLKMNRLWYIQYDSDLFYLQETIINFFENDFSN